jgi:hypothetical protein
MPYREECRTCDGSGVCYVCYGFDKATLERLAHEQGDDEELEWPCSECGGTGLCPECDGVSKTDQQAT